MIAAFPTVLIQKGRAVVVVMEMVVNHKINYQILQMVVVVALMMMVALTVKLLMSLVVLMVVVQKPIAVVVAMKLKTKQFIMSKLINILFLQ